MDHLSVVDTLEFKNQSHIIHKNFRPPSSVRKAHAWCPPLKGELLFIRVKQVRIITYPDFVLGVKCAIFRLNRGLRVHFDLYEADFQKKYLQVLFSPQYFFKLKYTIKSLLCQNCEFYSINKVSTHSLSLVLGLLLVQLSWWRVYTPFEAPLDKRTVRSKALTSLLIATGLSG